MKGSTFKPDGFTIIELLVVVSIVGLIASVALANLQKTRDQAKVAAGKEFATSVEHALSVEAIGKWNFNEGGGNVAVDSSGENHNGQIVGATYVPSDLDAGYALAFDGNSYITGDSFPNPGDNGKLTIMAWIKPQNIANRNTIFQIASNSCTSAEVAVDGGRVSVTTVTVTGGDAEAAGPPDTETETSPDRPINNNVWQQIAFVFNGPVVDTYIDGQKAATLTRGTSSCTNNAWAIGSSVIGNLGQGFVGIIDNVEVFNTDLTGSQVSGLYRTGRRQLAQTINTF